MTSQVNNSEQTEERRHNIDKLKHEDKKTNRYCVNCSLYFTLTKSTKVINQNVTWKDLTKRVPKM